MAANCSRERERERERRLTSGAVGADTLPPVTDTRESPRDLWRHTANYQLITAACGPHVLWRHHVWTSHRCTRQHAGNDNTSSSSVQLRAVLTAYSSTAVSVIQTLTGNPAEMNVDFSELETISSFLLSFCSLSFLSISYLHDGPQERDSKISATNFAHLDRFR